MGMNVEYPEGIPNHDMLETIFRKEKLEDLAVELRKALEQGATKVTVFPDPHRYESAREKVEVVGRNFPGGVSAEVGEDVCRICGGDADDQIHEMPEPT